MKRLLAIFILLTAIALFTVRTASANDPLLYCHKGQCSNSLSAFLEAVENTGTYYPAKNLAVTDEKITFDSVHFSYTVNIRFMDMLLAWTKGTVYSADWERIDTDGNLVHDYIDDLVTMFEESYKGYFSSESTFGLKPTWTAANKLPVTFEYIYDEKGLLGFYNSSGRLYIEPRIAEKVDRKAVIAHEMFHAIQHGVIGNAMWQSDKLDTFIEGTAVVMQHKLENWSSLHLSFLENSPHLFPRYSLFAPPQTKELTSYGAFTWYSFLDQKYRNNILTDALREYAVAAKGGLPSRGFVAVSEALKKRGTTLAEAYLEFVTWNFDNTKYKDSRFFKTVYITKTHPKGKTGPVKIDESEAPYLFGSNYIVFETPSASENLQITFSGNADADMHITFLSIDKMSGTVDQKNNVFETIEKGGTKVFTIPNNPTYSKVAMIVSVIDAHIESDNRFTDFVYPFSYEAKTVSRKSVAATESITLSAEELQSYFGFAPGQTLEYQIAVTEIPSATTQLVRTRECPAQNDCVVHSTKGGTLVNYAIRGKTITAMELETEAITPIEILSPSESDHTIPKAMFSLFDLPTENALQATRSCAPSLKPTSSSTNEQLLTLACRYQIFTSSGQTISVITEQVFQKGVGLIRWKMVQNPETPNSETITKTLVKRNTVAFASAETLPQIPPPVQPPSRPVNRRLAKSSDAMASILSPPAQPRFSDVSETYYYSKAIESLAELNIVSGYEDGTFRPFSTINRAEFTKIVIGARNGLELTGYNCFPDVHAEWFAPYVCRAKELGIVAGNPDGKFHPEESISTAAAYKIVLEAFLGSANIPESSGTWYQKYIDYATVNALLHTTAINVENPITRGEMAQLIVNVKNR